MTTRSRTAVATIAWLVLSAVTVGCGASPVPPSAGTDAAAAAASGTPAATPSRAPSPRPSPPPSPSPSPATTTAPAPAHSPAPSPSPTGASAGPRGDDAPVVATGRVVDVVDGDTVDLADGTRVRLAIVATPEIHGGVERCGPEATELTGSFLAGQTVAVYRPAAAPATDRFGRVVGEVVRVIDGASLNVALVRAGLGRIDERFTSEDPDLARRLRVAAAEADQPSCAPQSEAAPPPPAGDGASASGAHTGRTDGGWACHSAYRECLPQVGDLDCAEVGHSVTLLGDADPYRLDGRSTSREDGLGCESYGAWSASRTYPYE